MKTKIFFLLLCLSFSSTVLSQALLGINYEPFLNSADIGGDGISPYSISVLLEYKFDSTKSICLRPGFLTNDLDGRYFAGFNFSLLGKYQFNNSLYVLTGFNLHNNDATSSMFTKSKNRLITFWGLGFGVKPLPWLHIENLLFLPIFNKDIASFQYSNEGIGTYKIYYILKFGLGFEFEL
jgi:hypothetical protein